MREALVVLGLVREAREALGWRLALKSMALSAAQAVEATRVSVLASSVVQEEEMESRSSMELIWLGLGSGPMPSIELAVSSTPWRRST